MNGDAEMKEESENEESEETITIEDEPWRTPSVFRKSSSKNSGIP